MAPNSNPTRCYVANWSVSFQLGFLTMLCSLQLFVSLVSVACLQTSYLDAKCMTTINITFTFFYIYIKLQQYSLSFHSFIVKSTSVKVAEHSFFTRSQPHADARQHAHTDCKKHGADKATIYLFYTCSMCFPFYRNTSCCRF